MDILENTAYTLTPKGNKRRISPQPGGDVETLREALVENAASNDEELMEKFFEGEELSKEDILKGLLLGIESLDVVPVFATSATQEPGWVKELADALAAYMPAADKAKPVHARTKRARMWKSSAG